MTADWKKWNPGLDNDHLTLGEVKSSLPGAKQQDINIIVRLLENPKSPIALKGAVTLERHDCIHILLGRGLLNQDEAFVIGFTMGTSKNISRLEEFIFKTVSVYLYPKQYRFNSKHMMVYKFALEEGKKIPIDKIFEFPFEKYYNWKLGQLREKLKINSDYLRKIYRKEQKMLPFTVASKRLPV